MLDLSKIAGQIPGISQHLRQEANLSRQRLEQAENILEQTKNQQNELLEIHKKWRDKLMFTAAIPVEPLNTCIDLPSPPTSHTVFATDGSQLSPSHHEIAYCYLINIGRVMLHYGQSLHPLLDSIPEVFYRPEDLYISKQWGIRTEEWMGYRRSVSEAQMLVEMACNWVLPPGRTFAHPQCSNGGWFPHLLVFGRPTPRSKRTNTPPHLRGLGTFTRHKNPSDGLCQCLS